MNWHKAPHARRTGCVLRLITAGDQTRSPDVGFGIGLHGSMRRDLDLIAVPWVGEPRNAWDELAATIQKAACGLSNAKFAWEAKPCGRIATAFDCWSAHNVISSGHIDPV